MAIIHGEIESLRRIRETLNQKGITRFNSVGDIKRFLNNYESEREELFFKTERAFDTELDSLEAEGIRLQKNHDDLKTNTRAKLQSHLTKLKAKCEALQGPATNAIKELLNWYQLQILSAIKFILEKSSNFLIWTQTYGTEKRMESFMKKVNNYITNKDKIISERFDLEVQEIEYLKSVAAGLYPTMAGAIGENKVAKELGKLSDSNVLINDFSLTFKKPIYNKLENKLISRVQIDHLLITHAGIFIIETKNWSKASLERYDLRSPIKQVQRASYALYILLNGKIAKGSDILKSHHWGQKKLPIWNVVAMIDHRPKERFKFVANKTLKELNGYINNFEPIFDSSEVHSIANHLIRIKS